MVALVALVWYQLWLWWLGYKVNGGFDGYGLVSVVALGLISMVALVAMICYQLWLWWLGSNISGGFGGYGLV